MTSTSEPDARCGRCGAVLQCRPAGPCWCAELPPVMPVPEAAQGCLCPACLGEEIARLARVRAG